MNTHNSIKVENVYYIIKAFAQWVRTELKNEHNQEVRNRLHTYKYSDTQKSIQIQKMTSDEFVYFFTIRSPMTNRPYNNTVTKQIYDLFIGTSLTQNDVGLFIDGIGGREKIANEERTELQEFLQEVD